MSQEPPNLKIENPGKVNGHNVKWIVVAES